ncbi:MAG: sigma 54-interacting transcriptional regulator [Proteobacteria bacterium]|nr:sigma 54-interacting transcriptional regulator [Pseudomonadota bacterium]
MKPIPDFSNGQWEFLAALKAVGGSAPVDVIAALAPLSPGPLLDLVRRAARLGLLEETEGEGLTLAPDIGDAILARFQSINRPDRLRAISDRLDKLGLRDRLANGALAGLLSAAGRAFEAAVLETDRGKQAVRGGDLETGLNHLERAVALYGKVADDERAASHLVSTAMELSQLRFLLGRKIDQVPDLLKKARDMAARSGDRRSRVLIGLHYATFYYLNDRREEALEILALELAEVKELGDEDILSQCAEFFGLYYYLTGMYREASDYFDQALQAAAARGDLALYWPLQVFLGYSLACLGHFHRAIGLLDATRRRAMQQGESALASYVRAVLGAVLLMMNKRSEASFHVHGARSEAEAHDNLMARHLCDLILAYKAFEEGRGQEANERVGEVFSRIRQDDLKVRHYPTPYILEMLYELRRQGYEALAGMDFRTELAWMLESPNYHLKGVALRIRALYRAETDPADEAVLADLKAGEECLIRSGVAVELARTRTAMARFHLGQGSRDRAAALALLAWQDMSGHQADQFPTDLQFLIETRDDARAERPESEEMLERLFEMIGQLAPSPNLDELLGRLVDALNRFFRAERGGLFWFSDDRRKRPELKAARNMTPEEAFSERFRSSLNQVFRSFRERRPVLVRSERNRPGPAGEQPLSLICLPIEFKGRFRGVLYHDNSYVDDYGDFLNTSILRKLAGHVGAYVERIMEYGAIREERDLLVSARRLQMEGTDLGGILTRSPIMKRLLAEADRAAASGSTVLITGETGVGKELLARRIHTLGLRPSGPFIAVDLASTPENLVESDLFGHEKGAFTGAERQRPGRLELAHLGTLFIDELGEIPGSIQVKLLRVLQEKQFYRVGGSRILTSDFRLVAATNRNLEEEVLAGRFRRDLFYRLNVIPLLVPPLRDRPGDAVFLAVHFIELFAARLNRPPIRLRPEDETKLENYPWPGNIRELKNVIERAVLLSEGGALDLRLPGGPASAPGGILDDAPSLDELQRRYIRLVLDETGGRIGGPGGAAERLGMKRTSLYARMRKLGLF